MAPIVDTLEELDSDWFTDALREAGVLSAERSVSKAVPQLFGTGQFGLVLQVGLEHDDPTADVPDSVIVKLPSADEGSRRLGLTIGAYEAEVRFYQQILPQLDVAAPRMYWGDVDPVTGRFTLVLEDLSSTMRLGDAVGGGTPDQAAAVLEQLVRLQAPLWDADELRGKDWLAAPKRTQALFDYVAPALPAFRERFGPRLSAEHLELVEHLAPKAAFYPDRAWSGPLVAVHGDCRLDNILFTRGLGRSSATVLDWQTVRLGPPLIDACTYLGSCLSIPDRRAHQDELLGEYHRGLLDAGVTGFSFSDCIESFRQGSLYQFLLGVGMSVTLEKSERGDEMFAGLLESSAELVRDLDAGEFLA